MYRIDIRILFRRTDKSTVNISVDGFSIYPSIYFLGIKSLHIRFQIYILPKI